MMILVGNGTSLLDATNGALIDSFEVVTRFNQCVTKGHERHVGTRTDVWYTVLKYEQKRVDALKPRRIVAHSWCRYPLRCETYLSYAPVADRVEKLDHALVRELTEYAGCEYATWSTGALAIWRSLKTEDRVTITGFDWWDRSEHHYADRAVRGTLHKPEIERQMIERLRNEGRLEFL